MSQIKLVLAMALMVSGFSWAHLAFAEEAGYTVSKISFSQGVSASWEEDKPTGEKVFTYFQLSGGWEYTQNTYPRWAPDAIWKVKEYWYEFTRTSCMPREACVTLEDDYGRVDPTVMTFSGNDKVLFSGAGYHFVFSADSSLQEGLRDKLERNQTVDGPACWYIEKNRMKSGGATLVLPGGAAVIGRSTYGSAYTDWIMEAGEGSFYAPSCAPYDGGGKG